MYRKLLRHLVVFTALIMFPSFANAQDDGKSTGKHSMQISMDDFFKFSPLYGGIFSYKRHFTPKKALRTGFLLSGRIEQNTDSMIYNYNGHSPLTYMTYDTNKTVSIGMHLHYIRYSNPEKKMGFYYGAGPKVRYNYNYRHGREDIDATRNDVYWDKIQNYIFAVDGFAGLEWRFIENIGLLFEYPVSVAYIISKTTSSRENRVRNRETERFHFEYSNPKFGLSIYF